MSEENNIKEETSAPEDTTQLQEELVTEKRAPIRVSLSAAICLVAIFVALAVILTYTTCIFSFKEKSAASKVGTTQQSVVQGLGELTSLEILSSIFEAYSFEELDEELIRTEILKAYVRATGDKYAEFYTNEEYALIQDQASGINEGIGISIMDSAVTISGIEYKALKIVNIVNGSPAEKTDLSIGDFIIAIGTIDDYETISETGYKVGFANLRGESGTEAKFGYYDVDTEEIKFISVLREAFIENSVTGRKVDSNVAENVGIVKISSFDSTTPTQLVDEIEKLKSQGCDSFVFDLRYNPGGQLDSVAKILSYFLDEGDTIISMRDKKDSVEVITAEVSAKYDITAEDIGRYKGINAVVLCNENTASAAELFVANFRDHDLGTVIGTTTYGKGTVQTYMSYVNIGGELISLGGVLKLTVYMYYPPCGEGYDGVGITPDVEIKLSEEAQGRNIYDIMGTAIDNQLVAAVEYLK